LREGEEIEILTERAKRRLDAAYHLFKGGFYEDAVSRAYYSIGRYSIDS
jgi:uncharacterized protein (UPF0332 family)